MSRIRELRLGFIIEEHTECILHLVCEFFANWELDKRSHVGTVRCTIISLDPMLITNLLGTEEASPHVLARLNIPPPYLDIHHTLSGMQSTAKWTHNSHKGFHQTFPYSLINREAGVAEHCDELPDTWGALH